MPTVFILFGFIFKFYSDDHEPIHIHVLKDEISLIEGIIEENAQVITERWKEYFKSSKNE